MHFARPTPPRVYIHIVDPERKHPGRSVTVHGTNPAEMAAVIKRFVESQQEAGATGTQPITGPDARDAGMTLARG